MRKYLLPVIFLVLSAFSVSASELRDKIEKIPSVVNVSLLEKGLFKERYLVLFKQPVSHKDTSAGFFLQRVVVSHEGFDRPTLIVTEGYAGDRSLKPLYREEISKELVTNQIFVEHRFFGTSRPDSLNWKELTGVNSAADLHAIKQAFSQIYTKKWVASGISKGGQNTMIYATYYPEDVDAYVPYVGPVCKKSEDRRHGKFLLSVGRQSERDSILAIQREILSRRTVMTDMLEKYSKINNLSYICSMDELLDMCVLEFSFSMWQMGHSVAELPLLTSDDKTLFDFFVSVIGPDYFTVDLDSPFDVQSAAELGYYAYNLTGLKDLLSIKSSKGYQKRLKLPANLAKEISFSPNLSCDILNYLRKNDPKMLFIYGETDPWSAAMPDPRFADGKKNMHFYIQKRGSHRTRINTQPDNVKAEIWSKLRKWLDL